MSWEDDSIATRERCGVCQRVSPVGFHVPDALWRLAVPDYHRQSVLCLSCFVSYADERLLPWDRDITFYAVSLHSHLRGARMPTPLVAGDSRGPQEPTP